MVEELYQHHQEDEIRYLSEAKRLANEVEEILRAENEEVSYDQDCSWDVTTRREEVQQIWRESNRKEA